MIYILIIAAVVVVSVPCLVALVIYFRHCDHSTEAAEARETARLAQERVDRLVESIAAKEGYNLVLPQPVINQPLEQLSTYFGRKKRPRPVEVSVPNSNFKENTQ